MEAPENKKTKKAKRYCIAYGCSNSTIKTPSLSLFALPKDPERRQRWLNLIGREELIQKGNIKSSHYEVCEKHFEDSDIITTTLKKLTNDRVLEDNESSQEDDMNDTDKDSDDDDDD